VFNFFFTELIDAVRLMGVTIFLGSKGNTLVT